MSASIEKAMRDYFGDSMFQMVWNDYGRCEVVDLSGLDKPVVKPKPRWTDEDLTRLMLMKRRGHTMDEIEAFMGRDRRNINDKWATRNKWGHLIKVPRDNELMLEEIIRAVCSVFGVARVDFFSQRRTKNVCEARQVYYWIARKYTTRSFPQIGAHCGGRDHSTCMHGAAKVDSEYDRFKDLIELCLFDLGISESGENAA